MENISIIIPSRNEQYLDNTILDILAKTIENVEIIVVLDGVDARRIGGVKYIYNKKSKGMRTAINQGVALAKGKYIMKLDAHCMLDEGIDVKLIAEHQPNWIQVPRRKKLDEKKWKLIDVLDVDYMYIGTGYRGFKDIKKNQDPELKKKLIDDIKIFQGSCYFMERDYFLKLGLLDDVNFGTMGSEALEICLKCESDGGRIVRNKKTWYAHAYTTRHYAGSLKERDKSFKYIRTLLR